MKQRISIFIIDDDPDDQVLMQQAFESTNTPVSIRFATRSDEALEFLRSCSPEERPDIIVSDYNMPLMNGQEFLRQLSSTNLYADVPRVIVSTAASSSIIASCLESGASRYLIKPSDFDKLVKLASEIISLAIK